MSIAFVYKFHNICDRVLSDYRTILFFILLCDCEQVLRLLIPCEGLPDIMPSAELFPTERINRQFVIFYTNVDCLASNEGSGGPRKEERRKVG